MSSETDKSNSNQIAFLLIHGFTGAHFEMTPLEIFLVSEGYVVKNITLPGHETTVEELAETKWKDWINHAQNELNSLSNKYERVYISGLSMGGAITLYLGASNPNVSGIIAMAAPYKPVDWRMYLIRYLPIHWFYKYFKNEERGWEDLDSLKTHKSYGTYPIRSIRELHKLLVKVKKLVPEISIPILIIQSKNDPSVPPEIAKWVYTNVKTSDKQIAWIEKGGHVIPKDAGRFQLFEILKQWLEDRK